MADRSTGYVVWEEWVGEGWTVRDASLDVSITQDLMLHGTWAAPPGSRCPQGRS